MMNDLKKNGNSHFSSHFQKSKMRKMKLLRLYLRFSTQKWLHRRTIPANSIFIKRLRLFWRVLSVSRTAWALQILEFYVKAISDSKANISFTDQKTPVGSWFLLIDSIFGVPPWLWINLFDITLINRVFESFSCVYMIILSKEFEKFHFWVE